MWDFDGIQLFLHSLFTVRWSTNNTSLWLHKIFTIIEQTAKYFFLPLNWEMSSLLSISGNLSDRIGNYHLLQKQVIQTSVTYLSWYPETYQTYVQ